MMEERAEAHDDRDHDCYFILQYALDAAFSLCLCTSTKTALFCQETTERN